MRRELCGETRLDAAEVNALPKIAHVCGDSDTELLPRACHVYCVLVVRVEQQDSDVAVRERFRPHLRARRVVERHAVTRGGERVLVHGDDFGIREDFFSVAE